MCLANFLKKFEVVLRKIWDWGKMIHEKNMKQKIS